MITVITGLTGSGKTWFMSRLLLKRWKQGENIYPNLALNFPNDNERVIRWYNLDETYNISNGVLGIDEGQKLFNARTWAFLPIAFADKIASTRHQFIDVITTTQDFGHIDIVVRQNVHELYNCHSLLRIPKNERKKPIIQLIRITKRNRIFDDSLGVKWTKGRSKLHLISRFWTKDLYNTYANIDLSHFICQIKRKKKRWLIILRSRQLANSRRR